MAKQQHTFESICRDIRTGQIKPVYVLMGEEPYFIDQITNLLIDRVMEGLDPDFNKTILYGADTTVEQIYNAARRYPVMAERQLVVVREAQLIDHIDLLTNYVKKPLNSTILVINYKYKKLDGRKSLAGTVEKVGVLFDSKKLYDNQIPNFISDLIKRRNLRVQDNAVLILAEHLGNDLELLCKELDKLQMILASHNDRVITPELIEKHIGFSKDFTNFELVSALASKNVAKANRIIRYFEQSPKEHSIIVTLSLLFNFFSNLLICQYNKDQSEKAIMALLGIRFNFQVKDYLVALKNYKVMKVFNMVHEVRIADAKAKGIDAPPHMTHGDILKELVYKALH
jgi:DNA polymerase-3 subunit delta